MELGWAGYGVVELLFLLAKLWALFTWTRFPTWAWEESRHSRLMWLVLLILAFFMPCLGAVLALWFLFSTSTQLRRVTQLGHRPGFPT